MRKMLTVAMVAGLAALAQAKGGASVLDELMPVPAKVERLSGTAGCEALKNVSVQTAAVPGAPAATADEAYVLEIAPDGVKISAPGEKGERWARVTLGQLSRLAEGGSVSCCRITDWPYLKWRGCMLDTSRNYVPPQELKDFIDMMAAYKLNLFHWHLTENYAWRLESKKYPQLQSEKAFFYRHVGKYYTQKEFSEIVDYAYERGVSVMPELDVPGHAFAFRRAFGFKTMSDPGVGETMAALFDELCGLAPKEKMPFIHVGTDEVWKRELEGATREALDLIAKTIADNGRTVVSWTPGETYTCPGPRINMLWTGEATPDRYPGPYFDACGMYVEASDPFEMFACTVYRRVAKWHEPGELNLGGIFCAWHDGFVGLPYSNYFRNQNLYPSCVLFGNTYWRGRSDDHPEYRRTLPRGGDPLLAEAAEIERRVVAQRDKALKGLRHPFHFLCQTDMRWRVSQEDGTLIATNIAQATITFFRNAKAKHNLLPRTNGTVVAETWIWSPKTQDVGAWIGFTDISRDHGILQSVPLPDIGEWNRFGASAELNGEKIAPPKWKRPGVKRGEAFKDWTEAWKLYEADEEPFTDQEYYMREPSPIRLREGWNHVKLTVPNPWRNRGGSHRWVCTFIPVIGPTDHPREVEGLKYSCEPQNVGGVAEKPYDFRKRLECVHERDRRDPAAKPTAEEFAFTDGAAVAVPADADDVLAGAGKDFCDYLDVSMGVSARFMRGGVGTVTVKLDGAMPRRGYRTETDGVGICITAADSRAAAQALYHLEDVMNLRRAPFVRKGIESRRSLFSPRMTHSGWGVDVFPDAHLAQIAHAGMDAIVIFIKDVDKTKGADYQDVNDVIRRAKRHGLDTYLYSYIVAFVHPDDPGAKEKFDSTYGRVAAAYPEAKGIVFVGESCQFPTKDERAQPVTHRNRIPGDKRPVAGWWPCRDYPDWVKAVKRSIDAQSPGMEIVFWSYNWGRQPVQPRMELIDALPQDVTLQATFEMFEPQVKRNGLNAPSADYSLSFEGPGRYFASEAERAHKRGLRLYSMSNAGGLTWDYGVIPYQPCPYQWHRRYEGLCKAQRDWGLSGLMECHHYGWWPSFISELEKEAFTEGGIPFEKHLRMIAARDFGEQNADRALEAWKLWSETARDYVASDDNQYGPFRLGPSYPYNFGGKRIENKEFPCPPYASFGVRIARLNYLDWSGYRPELGERKKLDGERMAKEIELLESMQEKLGKGADMFDAIAAALPCGRAEKARRMAGLGRFMQRTVITAINVKHGALAHLAGNKDEVLAWAKREYANAKAALPLVEADSRLGWEPSMEYVGGAEQVRWKLARMRETYGPDVAR